MAMTADDILYHPALEFHVRGQAKSLLQINDASPRLASLFGTRQRWLMAHAALSQYFRDAAAAATEADAGTLAGRLVDLVVRYEIASPNTATAFLKELMKYGIVQHVAASEGRRVRPIEPTPITLAALFLWHQVHLTTLDGLDGGGRVAALRAEPEKLRRIQPLIADGLLGSAPVRKPEPTFALFAWVDEGGIVMDRLIVGCEHGTVSNDRITTDVRSISGLALRLKLSRTQLSRKIAEAEAMGSLGWLGRRGRSPVWVSTGFQYEYHKAQALKLAIIDAAFDACFARDQRRDVAGA
jgi:hypothetical protein